MTRVRISDPAQRFWSYVDRSGDCWLWTGAKSTGGYGRIFWSGKLRQAHRIAYQLEVGPIPEGLELDHLCRVRACVNPAHLEPVTTRVNLLRGVGASATNARRTHCENGHPFTPENTYTWRGDRHCRTCRAEVSSSRVRPGRSRIDATCVMCGSTFTFVRGPGRSPNVCSDVCRSARDRRKARDHARRKRAAARST